MKDQAIEVIYQSPRWNESDFQNAGGYVCVVLGYNHANCIGDAVESALSQQYPCYEVLLMDDASNDDTYRIMCDRAKNYKYDDKRIVRVISIENKENLSVAGQWNQAVNISTGKWFGMFCGDDVSYPNRIKIANEIIARHDTAWAICTNFTIKNGGVYFGQWRDERVWKGKSDLSAVDGLPLQWYFGCSAWWHRDLLRYPLPRHNIDDDLLFWRTLILRQNDSNDAIVWAMNEMSVAYDKSSGVTNNFGKGYRWRFFEEARHYRRWKALCVRTYSLTREFDNEHGRPGFVRDVLRGKLLCCSLYSGNWLQRNLAALNFYVFKCHDTFGGTRKSVGYEFSHYYPRYFLGYVSFVAISTLKWLVAYLRGKKIL